MKLITGIVAAYVADCGVCLLAPESLTTTSNFVWVLGPPASLIYKSQYLPPFIVGTLVVAAVFYGIGRARTIRRRRLLLLVLLLSWSFFGFVAYAPGA